MSAVYLGYAALAAYARPTSAVSPEAGQVCEASSEVMRSREESESLFGQKMLALSRLQSAVAEVFVDEEQEAVKSQVLRNAEQFLIALPDDLPSPEFSVEPDGAVSLDWIDSRTRMFSVSVTESERLAYAWLNGSDRGHGVARFRSPEPPRALVSLMQSFVSDYATVLRAA